MKPPLVICKEEKAFWLKVTSAVREMHLAESCTPSSPPVSPSKSLSTIVIDI